MFQPRSEEEKTRDILFHEKRTAAADRIGEFQKNRRKALLIACICGVVLFAAACPLFLAAYDSERLWLLAILFCCYVVLTVLSFYISGAFLCRSLRKFLHWSRLRSRWRDAVAQMDAVAEGILAGNLYEADRDKAETAMETLADEILHCEL